jgi:hypothetical protein
MHTGQHKHRINAHRYPNVEMGFDPPFPVFEQAKAVYALDCEVIVIDK